MDPDVARRGDVCLAGNSGPSSLLTPEYRPGDILRSLGKLDEVRDVASTSRGDGEFLEVEERGLTLPGLRLPPVKTRKTKIDETK